MKDISKMSGEELDALTDGERKDKISEEDRIKRLKKRIAAESGYFGELPDDSKFLTRAEVEAWDKEHGDDKNSME